MSGLLTDGRCLPRVGCAGDMARCTCDKTVDERILHTNARRWDDERLCGWVGGILTVCRVDQRRPRYQKPPPPSSNTTTMIMIRRVRVSISPLLLPPGTSPDGGTTRECEEYTDESVSTIAPCLP